MKEQSYTLERLRQERHKMAHRKRRIIFNNDGDDVLHLGSNSSQKVLASQELRGNAKNCPVTQEGLLELRTTDLLGSQVDAIWYFSSWGMKLHYGDGAFGRLYGPAEPGDPKVGPFIRNAKTLIETCGRDCLEIMVETGHQHGLEVFFSNRMNDIHDSYPGQFGKTRRIRRDKPHWCLSTKEEGIKHGYPDVRSMWSAWNFEVPEVRRLMVEAMREVCQSYDVDGIELDFLRNSMYFPESMQFKAVGQKNINLMTEMVRDIRKVTEQEGLKRGRPILLAVRIPEDEKLSLSVGLDVRTWLTEGLVDVLVPGQWLEFTVPTREIIDLGHSYGVPVYGQNHAWWKGTDYGFTLDPTVWRADALKMFAEGADGIYMFNVFDPTLRLWWELGDPNTLRTVDRTYVWDYLPSWRKRSDVYGQLRLLTRSSPSSVRLSVQVTEKGCEPITLFVGESFAEGNVPELALRVHVTGLTVDHGFEIKVNEKAIGDGELSEVLADSPKDVWLEFQPEAGLFRKGENLITATVAAPSKGAEYPKIDQVRLDVRCEPMP